MRSRARSSPDATATSISRTAMPGPLTVYAFDHGISWLTVLADMPPAARPLMAISVQQVRRAVRPRPEGQQVLPAVRAGRHGRRLAAGPDPRQLRARSARADLAAGPITDTEVLALRSVVYEPIATAVVLLGDAAHLIARWRRRA